jgi:hypothetical protein
MLQPQSGAQPSQLNIYVNKIVFVGLSEEISLMMVWPWLIEALPAEGVHVVLKQGPDFHDQMLRMHHRPPFPEMSHACLDRHSNVATRSEPGWESLTPTTSSQRSV